MIDQSLLNVPFGTAIGDWRIEPLCEHVFFQEGPGLREWQWASSGMKVVNGRNILLDGTIDTSNTERYISQEEFNNKYRHFAIEPGDILVTSSGTIGKIAKIRALHLPMMMNTSVIRFHPKSDNNLDRAFLYAFLRSHFFQNQAATFATGAAQSNFGPAHIKQMRIVLPPLPTQRKIAAILSAYDDLIENNTRRIKILEVMAQALYREWFVHFHFPGHEEVQMVESELGLVPEGWEVGRLDDALVLQRGFDLPTHQRQPGDVPIYAATGIAGTHREAKVSGPGVVTGRSGSLGTVLYIDRDFWPLNTALWVKEFKRSTPIHAYYLLRGLSLGGFNSGAAVPTLNRNDIHGLSVTLPPWELLQSFDQKIVPMFQLTRSLERKNANLRRTRDLLLPKLISGEVDVESLEVR
jgi:type I restriction enzyme, S subunit